MCDDAIVGVAKNCYHTRRCSTGVVQLIRNQQAVSSNLIIGFKKRVRLAHSFLKTEYHHNRGHRRRVMRQGHRRQAIAID